MKTEWKWEYKIWRPAMHPQYPEAQNEMGADMERRDYWTQKWLNELGSEGWELVYAPQSPSNETFKWVFKRPIEKITMPESLKQPGSSIA